MLSGYLLFFRSGLQPRFCYVSKSMPFCNYCIGLPIALLTWAAWVVLYACFAIAPLAGAIYFHVGDALEFPEWESTFSGVFLTVFLLGTLSWCCCCTACCTFCACGCTNPELFEAVIA